ncbi:MAG: YoaK family protein [Pseudolabrys sp.]
MLGSHGIIGKILALPMFILVIALARLAGGFLRGRKKPVLRILLSVEVALLVAFFALAVRFGPFPNPDSPAALLTGFAGIAAMALQNALQRVHLSSLPPTTLMTGSTTQATIDLVDLISGADPQNAAAIRARFGRLSLSILYFAAGCATAATLFWFVGFWCLALAVIVGAAAALMRAEAAP